MAKRFSTLETTRLAFEHAGALFPLIQRMDREGVRYIREHELVREVRRYTRGREAPVRQRLELAFATENLFQCGLVVDTDKVDGELRLVLHESLVGLLRTCNESLYQELTDARLRRRLVGLWNARQRLAGSSFSDADPDFTELLDDLFEQLSHLVGLVRQNIRRMQAISRDLADISGDASRAPEEFQRFRGDLLGRIAHLYERHIKPTLAFLNRDVQLEEGENLFATLEGIQQLLERHDKLSAADQVFRTGLSLNAAYKPIQQVAREVDHFLRKTRAGMLQYNAMEHHYQRLLEAHRRTRTQDLRRTRLDGEAFARDNGFVLGLKRRGRPRPYAFGSTTSYYRMLFSELELRLADLRRAHEAPVLPEVAARREGPRRDLERSRRLYAWIDSLELRPTGDLVRELHGRLDGVVDGYVLPDLLACLQRLEREPRPGLELRVFNRFRTLTTDDGDTWIYRRRQLLETSRDDRDCPQRAAD